MYDPDHPAQVSAAVNVSTSLATTQAVAPPCVPPMGTLLVAATTMPLASTKTAALVPTPRSLASLPVCQQIVPPPLIYPRPLLLDGSRVVTGVDIIQVVKVKLRDLGQWNPDVQMEKKLGQLASFVVSEVAAIQSKEYELKEWASKLFETLSNVIGRERALGFRRLVQTTSAGRRNIKDE